MVATVPLYGNKMGHHSDKELNYILEQFKVERAWYVFNPLNQGYINDTYLVLNQDVPLYVLQRINHTVFKDIEGLMGNIDKALAQLRDADYTKIKLIRTQLGKTYFNEDQGVWRLMTFIDQSSAHNTTTDAKIAYEAGRIIGKFHVLLQDADINDYVDTIPRFHDLASRKKEFEESLNSANPMRIKKAKDPIGFVNEIFEKLDVLGHTVLPLRVCHNDTKLNNILFSQKDVRALCLIDLDTLMKGYFYYDFGDAVRTIANTAPEDEKNHDKITFDKNLFEAFVDGLAVNGPFLNQSEVATLPLGAIFMPFIHGLRALTDYLNNDVYYKVAYENQNLDRCLSLFNFTQKALDQLAFMKIVVKEKLSAK